MATELTEIRGECPYCGESLDLLVDASAGSMAYIEDCQVCCRPIEVGLEIGADGEIVTISLTRDDA